MLIESGRLTVKAPAANRTDGRSRVVIKEGL